MTINHPKPPRKIPQWPKITHYHPEKPYNDPQTSSNTQENPRYHPEKFHNNSKSPTTNHKNSTNNFCLPPTKITTTQKNPIFTHYHQEIPTTNSHPLPPKKIHNTKKIPQQSTTTQKNHRKIHTTKVNVTTTYCQLRKSYNDPLPPWKVPRKLAKSHLSNQI